MTRMRCMANTPTCSASDQARFARAGVLESARTMPDRPFIQQGILPSVICDLPACNQAAQRETAIITKACSKQLAAEGDARILDARMTECTNCSSSSALGAKGLLRCSRCLAARYCSRECQRSHWKAGHKQVCVPYTEWDGAPQGPTKRSAVGTNDSVPSV